MQWIIYHCHWFKSLYIEIIIQYLIVYKLADYSAPPIALMNLLQWMKMYEIALTAKSQTAMSK